MMSSSNVINALRTENERLKLAEREVLKQEKMEQHKQQGNASRSKSSKSNKRVDLAMTQEIKQTIEQPNKHAR